MSTKIEVNAMGDACPLPVVKTLKALKQLDGEGAVVTAVDNETAVKNISKTNYALLSALYLLTADQRLWGCCKHHIYRRRASAEKVYHRYIAVQKKKQ